MTHTVFTNLWNGKYIDFDGVAGYQCVDLMRKYVKDVLGLPGYNEDLKPLGVNGHSKDLFYRLPDGGGKYFSKVYNGKTNSPSEGDIVFFKTSWLPPWLYGRDGHVAIAHTANSMNLVTFDQNWPSKTSCHFQRHTYKDCLGWLHKK